MRRLGGRLLALLLALLIAAAGMTWAAAEDWRDLLRDLYGLTDDYAADDPGEQDRESEEQTEVEFELPVTDPQQIVNYLDIYGELPENFITKNEAKALGWDSRYNYVGEVAPGKSIGGDRFGNYEGILPSDKKYRECDIDYKGGKRGAKRIVFSEDATYIYYTEDHYESFEQLYP